MTVVYDDHAFRQRFGGVPKYFTEVIRRLPSDIGWKIAAKVADNEFVHESPFDIPSWPLRFMRTWRGVDRRYEKFMLMRNERLFAEWVNGGMADLVHLTEPHYYRGYWRCVPAHVPMVVTIYDLIPEIWWKNAAVRKERAALLDRVQKVVAISEYTKDRMQELYGVPDDKVEVVHLGYTPVGNADSTPVFKDLKYILYVGGRYDYKNFDWMMSAVAPLLRDDPELHLVCTGLPFSPREVESLTGIGIASKVIQRAIPDSQMQSLYAHAQAFIYPSKMEGFGIPILDAFAAKCPVILSNCSCFPEVGGNAAVYFEDGDADGLCQQILEVLKDDSLRSQMRERGSARLANFSWDKTASKTVEVYRSLTLK